MASCRYYSLKIPYAPKRPWLLNMAATAGPVGQPDIAYTPRYENYKTRTTRRIHTEKLVQYLPEGFPAKLDSDLVWDGNNLEESYDWNYHLTPADLAEVDEALKHFKCETTSVLKFECFDANYGPDAALGKHLARSVRRPFPYQTSMRRCEKSHERFTMAMAWLQGCSRNTCGPVYEREEYHYLCWCLISRCTRSGPAGQNLARQASQCHCCPHQRLGLSTSKSK